MGQRREARADGRSSMSAHDAITVTVHGLVLYKKSPSTSTTRFGHSDLRASLGDSALTFAFSAGS